MKTKPYLFSSRKLKRKHFLLKLVKILAVFSISLIFSLSFIYLSYFRIKNIEVIGQTLKKEEMVRVIKNELNGYFMLFAPKNNIFFVKKEKIIKQLRDNFPEIKKIDIKNKYFQSAILVNLNFREVFASYCQKQDCFYVDEGGVIFSSSPEISGGLILKIFDERESFQKARLGQKIKAEKIDEILNFVKKLPLLIPNKIREIALKNENSYEVIFDENFRVILDSEIESDKAAKNLKIALDNINNKEKLEYIDLRFDNKVYYKIKGGAEI